jgi:hypothetical protein
LLFGGGPQGRLTGCKVISNRRPKLEENPKELNVDEEGDDDPENSQFGNLKGLGC